MDRAAWQVVTQASPSEAQWRDLELGWRVCAAVSSNAIVIAAGAAAVGIGAGQQNRVDSARIAADKAGERARTGGGPTLVEALTYRITGHSRRDPCNYQPEAERKKALEHEPIGRFAARLVADRVTDQAALDGIRAEVDAEIERAVESAMAAPDPRPEDALEGLYV